MKSNVQSKIMDLKIFNEKTLNKANDEDTATELFTEGEKGLSLNKIINTKRDNLDELIFEIDTDDQRDEEDS